MGGCAARAVRLRPVPGRPGALADGRAHEYRAVAGAEFDRARPVRRHCGRADQDTRKVLPGGQAETQPAVRIRREHEPALDRRAVAGERVRHRAEARRR